VHFGAMDAGLLLHAAVLLAVAVFAWAVRALRRAGTPVPTLLPAVTLMSIVVIPREERYLAERFASEHLPYKSAVRRWL
jgi:protein-S-isoprenylcysteine O-methyltransferase Ste14